MQDAVVAAAREYGMRLLGPNALGAFNSNLGYYAFFSTSLERGVPLPGRVGIATQSAPTARTCSAWRASAAWEPLSAWPPVTRPTSPWATASAGWWSRRRSTWVMAYAESIRNVDSFLAALEAAHRAGKPVILHKVGRSALVAARRCPTPLRWPATTRCWTPCWATMR
ncbi:hypothetical protein [Pseudomonas aeruginosa]|uniref:hypothetical protein n=1 Tax=Pseudomonas aeruginosa TaxID=287 RepID=UPI003D27E984